MIGNHHVVRVQRALDSVQSLQLFAFARAANDDAALDLVQVEGVGGLAHRQPGVIGGVHGVRNHLLLEQAKVGGHLRAGKPVARVADGHIAQHPRREAATGLPRLDDDGEGLAGRLWLGQFEGKPGNFSP